MNAPIAAEFLLPDIQSTPDLRNVAIDAVGVGSVRYPVILDGPAGPVPTAATFTMTVALPPEAKGTHMSRFIEALEAGAQSMRTQRDFVALVHDVRERLGSEAATIEMRFPYFVRKAAPVSGAASLLDCDAAWIAEARVDGTASFTLAVTTPVTSLCPCSKEISAYGAHNQRSHVRIEARLSAPMRVEELVAIAERSASCELYGLLKRPDEKHVTERAYENPKFVEDVVRDAALALAREPRVAEYAVDAENFESIHNHSAIARIRSPGSARGNARGPAFIQ